MPIAFTEQLKDLLRKIGVREEIGFTAPPNPEMGDLAFACFGLAKEWKMNPAEAARDLAKRMTPLCHPRENGDPDIGRRLDSRLRGNDKLISAVRPIGPYVNFFINPQVLAKLVLSGRGGSRPARTNIGRAGKIMIEFAHPNTHKPVHIGHLRNMITGDSLVRIFEDQGYKVARANYQGDVGMHIAKCLWGIESIKHPASAEATAGKEVESLKSIGERARFLGEAYARGGQAYEKDEQAKKEIEEINAKIYAQDKSIWSLYKKTRKWSLEYFDFIYKKVGVKKFDRLYFESEVFKSGIEAVSAGLKKDIFKESQGAVIFEGSKHGLHDRVFINSKGLPTYEAKDMALAKLQFKEYHPDFIYHVVAKEQTEYFKVIFKALEFLLPESAGKEKHLVYGWVSLKEGKMSSRTGQVVLAEWLLYEAERKIAEVMKDREIEDQEGVIQKVALAAVKYSMLKTSISNDIIFDFKESVSLSGDSGPYLLYIVARIESILRKSKVRSIKYKVKSRKYEAPVSDIKIEEKKLLLELAKFEEIVRSAALAQDPSKIAHCLLALAQSFNQFYDRCPVLQAEESERIWRLRLIQEIDRVMSRGLYLLGIETVDQM